MSPAKSKKAARKAGTSTKKAAAKPAKRPAGKPRKASKAATKAPAKPAQTATAAAAGHPHCAASDPFGDACQNRPRRPSKYCVIHSYLER